MCGKLTFRTRIVRIKYPFSIALAVGEAENTDETTKLFNLPNPRRRLAREKIWRVSAAALPGWLQVFASPHFSRLPSLFYLEDSPRTPMGTADSRSEVFYLGVSPRPPAPNNKTKRMFRYARSGCRTPPPRILHLLRCTFPTLIVRRKLRPSPSVQIIVVV